MMFRLDSLMAIEMSYKKVKQIDFNGRLFKTKIIVAKFAAFYLNKP